MDKNRHLRFFIKPLEDDMAGGGLSMDVNNHLRISTSSEYKKLSALAMVLAVNPTPATTSDMASIRFLICPVKCEAVYSGNPEELGKITNYFPAMRVVSSVTIPDVIEQAQNILGISKQHLAVVFGTSRQNLYNLLKNNEQVPTQETEARAMQVKQALDIISEICPYKLGASTMTCRIDGRRLLDELSESEINLAQVRVFAQEINKRIQAQQQSNLPESIIRNQEFIDTFNAI